MPIYELKCQSCGKFYERLVGTFFPDPEKLACECGGSGEKQVSVPGVARVQGGTNAQRNG